MRRGLPHSRSGRAHFKGFRMAFIEVRLAVGFRRPTKRTQREALLVGYWRPGQAGPAISRLRHVGQMIPQAGRGDIAGPRHPLRRPSVAPPGPHRYLTVAPLISYQRCYGEVTVRSRWGYGGRQAGKGVWRGAGNAELS